MAEFETVTCPDKANCITLDTGKSIEQNLKIRDKEKNIFTIDTGSALLNLNASYCEKKNMHFSKDIAPQQYASTNVIRERQVDGPVDLLELNQKFDAACTNIDLHGTGNGLIGMAIEKNTGNKDYASNSFMQQYPENEKVFHFHREEKKVCIGQKCEVPEKLVCEDIYDDPRETTILWPMFSKHNYTYLPDTGSTVTFDQNNENNHMCVVGFQDINQLHINYKTNKVCHDLNWENIHKICNSNSTARNKEK